MHSCQPLSQQLVHQLGHRDVMLERDGRGLNLTAEVRDGILKHTKGKGNVTMRGAGLKCLTLEAEVAMPFNCT